MPQKSYTPAMFKRREKERDPRVIVQTTDSRQMPTFDREVVAGSFWRVHPQSEREISALRLLDHRADKFAPAEGDGVIISHAALAKFDGFR